MILNLATGRDRYGRWTYKGDGMAIIVRPTRLPDGGYIYAYMTDSSVLYYTIKRKGERESEITRSEYMRLLTSVR